MAGLSAYFVVVFICYCSTVVIFITLRTLRLCNVAFGVVLNFSILLLIVVCWFVVVAFITFIVAIAVNGSYLMFFSYSRNRMTQFCQISNFYAFLSIIVTSLSLVLQLFQFLKKKGI